MGKGNILFYRRMPTTEYNENNRNRKISFKQLHKAIIIYYRKDELISALFWILHEGNIIENFLFGNLYLDQRIKNKAVLIKLSHFLLMHAGFISNLKDLGVD